MGEGAASATTPLRPPPSPPASPPLRGLPADVLASLQAACTSDNPVQVAQIMGTMGAAGAGASGSGAGGLRAAEVLHVAAQMG